MVVDERGRPRRFVVRPGHHSDASVTAEPIEGFEPELRLADAAYDANALRTTLIGRGPLPVIPNNLTNMHRHPFGRALYKPRNAVERTLCRLKGRRSVATRYGRLAD